MNSHYNSQRPSESESLQIRSLATTDVQHQGQQQLLVEDSQQSKHQSPNHHPNSTQITKTLLQSKFRQLQLPHIERIIRLQERKAHNLESGNESLPDAEQHANTQQPMTRDSEESASQFLHTSKRTHNRKRKTLFSSDAQQMAPISTTSQERVVAPRNVSFRQLLSKWYRHFFNWYAPLVYTLDLLRFTLPWHLVFALRRLVDYCFEVCSALGFLTGIDERKFLGDWRYHSNGGGSAMDWMDQQRYQYATQGGMNSYAGPSTYYAPPSMGGYAGTAQQQQYYGAAGGAPYMGNSHMMGGGAYQNAPGYGYAQGGLPSYPGAGMSSWNVPPQHAGIPNQTGLWD